MIAIKYWSLAKNKTQSSVGRIVNPPVPEKNSKDASVLLNIKARQRTKVRTTNLTEKEVIGGKRILFTYLRINFINRRR